MITNGNAQFEVPVNKRPDLVQWRVGTISMGASLVLLGIVTFMSMWKGTSAFDVALAWWPVIFILLGIEIISYSVLRSHNRLYYDLVSIFFVGLLSILCVVFAALSSLGLVDELRETMLNKQVTQTIPTRSLAMPKGVDRVIVQGLDYHSVHIDNMDMDEVQVLGQYRASDGFDSAQYEENAIQFSQAGNIVYVLLSDPPRSFLDDMSSQIAVTVVAPKGVEVEVR